MKGKGCRIKLEQVETLKLMTKIDLSFDEFFESDGHITFINKMAAFLNIEPTRIKIVSIIPGSTVVTTKITNEEDNEETEDKKEDRINLKDLKKKLSNASKAELSASLGVNILEVTAEHHDTGEYDPNKPVPEELRNKFLDVDEEKGEEETVLLTEEKTEEPDKIILWGWIVFGIILGVAFVVGAGW